MMDLLGGRRNGAPGGARGGVRVGTRGGARGAGVVAVVVAVAACGGEIGPRFDVPMNDAVVGDTPVAMDVPTGMCRTQGDCDDGHPCTEDLCVVGGVCEHTTNDRMCPAGQRCFVGRGCASGTMCMTNTDCNDNVMCTQDICAAGNTCQNVRDDSRCDTTQVCSATLGCVARGRCGTEADCDNRVFCDGTERCVMGMCGPGTPPNCADTDPCTGDICDETARMCTHPPVMPCGGSVTPGMYTLAPAATYTCGAGTLGPVSAVTLAVAGANVTVTGFPVTLTGTQSMGMFSARGTWPWGGCTWQISLTGAFTMPNRFTGSWNVSFDFCSAFMRCDGGGGSVMGTMR